MKYIALLYDKNNKIIQELSIPHCYPIIEVPVLPPHQVIFKDEPVPSDVSVVYSRTFKRARQEWHHDEPYEYVKRIRYDEVDEE